MMSVPPLLLTSGESLPPASKRLRRRVSAAAERLRPTPLSVSEPPASMDAKGSSVSIWLGLGSGYGLGLG